MSTGRERDDVLPAGTLTAVVMAGFLALFGTYWDEAWHTNIGRDSLLSPPHLVLYAGTAGVLLGVAWWAWRAPKRRSLKGLAGDRPLRLALLGAAAAAASAPIDAAWHAAFGRDAVLWSPPHILAVAGFIAVAAGVLAALRSEPLPLRRLIVATTTALLLAACLVPVMEYEGDVPQFAEVWYLPVTTAGIVLAFAVAERVDPWRWLATTAAVIYTGLRILLSGAMATLDHSTQIVPPVIAAGLVFDLTRGRRPLTRAAALGTAVAVSYTPALNFVYGGVQVGIVDLVVGVPLMILIALAVLAAQQPRPTCSLGSAAMVSVLALVIVSATPAVAHDPGQGEPVVPIALSATATDEHAEITATVTDQGCEDLEAVRTVARRAGVTTAGPLIHVQPCVFHGEVELPNPSRWFVYVEVGHHGTLLEAWVPIHRPDIGADPISAAKQDWLYIPAGGVDFSPGQWAAGITLYLVTLGLLVESILVSRHAKPATGQESGTSGTSR